MGSEEITGKQVITRRENDTTFLSTNTQLIVWEIAHPWNDNLDYVKLECENCQRGHGSIGRAFALQAKGWEIKTLCFQIHFCFLSWKNI